MPHDHVPGRVSLVGAGAGAADLLTVRAAKAIAGAKALLYDALVSSDVLDLAPLACLKIQTGKRAGRASMKQETINKLRCIRDTDSTPIQARYRCHADAEVRTAAVMNLQ